MKYINENLERMDIDLEELLGGEKDINEVKESIDSCIDMLIAIYSDSWTPTAEIFELFINNMDDESREEYIYTAYRKLEDDEKERLASKGTIKERIEKVKYNIQNLGLDLLEESEELQKLLNEI